MLSCLRTFKMGTCAASVGYASKCSFQNSSTGLTWTGKAVRWFRSLNTNQADLLRKFKISEHLVPELSRRYKAITFWAERCRPDNRKSLPSYRKCRCSIATTTCMPLNTLSAVQLTHFTDCYCNWTSLPKLLRSRYLQATRSSSVWTSGGLS